MKCKKADKLFKIKAMSERKKDWGQCLVGIKLGDEVVIYCTRKQGHKGKHKNNYKGIEWK